MRENKYANTNDKLHEDIALWEKEEGVKSRCDEFH